MEREGSGEHAREATAVARSQNTVYVLPHDAAAMRQFLAPALERVEREAEGTQLLVISTDAETAIELARATAQLEAGETLRTVPVTAASRAARLLRALPPHVVIGAPSDLLELVRGATLKLDRVRGVIVAWADHLVGAGDPAPLEALMSELPKDAARTVVASRLTTATEEWLERYARRAGRKGVLPREEDALARTDLRFVAVSPAGRPAALRRLLDDLDPERAAVYVRSDDAEHDVRGELRALGAGDSVTVLRGEGAAEAPLLVLYEVPGSPAELRAAVGRAETIVALASPRQVESLRALAGGGRVTPLALSGPAARARGREETLRAELRAELAQGAPAREMLALEPLLDEFDGVELAAAALRLLDRARERRGGASVESAAAPAPASPWTRIFFGIGKSAGVAPGDFVGAIVNEAGVPKEKVGKIELRDTHTLVEVAADTAEHVVQSLRGVMIRGRQAAARLDRQPAERRTGERRGAERPFGDRGFGDRPRGERKPGGPRGERGGFGERSARPPRDRDAGPPRGDARRSSRPPRRDD